MNAEQIARIIDPGAFPGHLGKDDPGDGARVASALSKASDILAILALGEGERPIPMILHCPACGLQHIDKPEFAAPSLNDAGSILWDNPPHRSHLCHGCGHIWRPADVPTEGVASISTKGKADSPPADLRSRLSAAEAERDILREENIAHQKYLPEVHKRLDEAAAENKALREGPAHVDALFKELMRHEVMLARMEHDDGVLTAARIWSGRAAQLLKEGG